MLPVSKSTGIVLGNMTAEELKSYSE